uniref:NR LBD domain-containing protein n=1 Tax=Glossina brevipalpis TaxID=37001 RepID=A0A1A9X285_9MUSC
MVKGGAFYDNTEIMEQSFNIRKAFLAPSTPYSFSLFCKSISPQFRVNLTPKATKSYCWAYLNITVQHERGPRKPKIHPQLHQHHHHQTHHHHHHHAGHHVNGLPPHPAAYHHHHAAHLPVSLVTNVSASFNYTSHISTHHAAAAAAAAAGFHGPPHPTAFHHPSHVNNGAAGSHSTAHLSFPPHLLPQMHHNLIAEATSKLPAIAAAATATTAATMVGTAASVHPPSSTNLPTYDLTASRGDSSSGAGSTTSLEFYNKTALTHNYSSPSPSDSIQSISSVGGRSSPGSESPRLNVETETPSPPFTPVSSSLAQEPLSPTDTNTNSQSPNNNDKNLLNRNFNVKSTINTSSSPPTPSVSISPTTPAMHMSAFSLASNASSNQGPVVSPVTATPLTTHTSSSPTTTTTFTSSSAQAAAAASALYAARQNGFIELLLSPDKCQEIIQYQMHNSLMFPPLPQQLIGLDSRLISWEMLQETTARLLFMAVRWVKCLMPFQTLSRSDQVLLLQGTLSLYESWKELFLLNLAQWITPLDLTPIFDSALIKERLPQDATTDNEIKIIQEIFLRFRQLVPDGSEVGCMKAIVLFTPDVQGLSDIQPVEMLQDQAQCILSDHVRLRYPRQQATRYGRLLWLLPTLRSIRTNTIESLFFKETIGNVAIARLLKDIFQIYVQRFHTKLPEQQPVNVFPVAIYAQSFLYMSALAFSVNAFVIRL